MELRLGAFDAKNQLSELLRRVQAGDVVVITRHNHPVAKLVPWDDKIDPHTLSKAFSSLRKLREKAAAISDKTGAGSSERSEGRSR